MTRTVGSHGPTTADAIMKEGLGLIYEHSYEAFTLRELADRVGIRAGSLYNYIASKQDLLARLVIGHLQELLDAAQMAVPRSGNPGEAINAFVEFHLRYHMNKRKEVSVNNSELRSLEKENRRIAVELRHRYEQILIEVIERAVEARLILPRDPRVTAFAIIAMLTGTCTWYDPRGPLQQDQIIALHTDLVLRGLAPVPVAAREGATPEGPGTGACRPSAGRGADELETKPHSPRMKTSLAG